MPDYRRFLAPGGTWFFTVNLLNRNSRLLVERIDALQSAIEVTRRRFPFEIDALVVLPEHLHAILTLPGGDTDFPLRWGRIKSLFSRVIPGREPVSASRGKRGERGIWQRRFWEHLIRDEGDYVRHMAYCWFNPVKHGHVENVEDWPWSTFHSDMGETPPREAVERYDRSMSEDRKAGVRLSFGERDEP